jgi:predicted Ser/Thr protein kinase
LIDVKRRLPDPQGILHQIAQRQHPQLLRHQPQSTTTPIQELGKGAYGVVYKGKEKNGSEWRAIKKIAKKNIKQPELLLN